MLAPLRRYRSEAADAELPERVREAIRRQQDRSEILIGWIQLAVVATFGTLYAIAPKTSPMTGFEPVPWALAAYMIITLARLGVAYRRRLPGWLLSLSVAVDIALLYTLMYSFHLQYHQPPSFILKAPALLYVFIFIALRALRFEARYVLLAGFLAVIGWLLMVLYVVTDEKGNPMITHSYVDYLTSNSVLLGAEFDKTVSMATVAVILAVALARARRLLVRAVAEGAAARDLSRFFAPEVAREIRQAEGRIAAGEGAVREAAILNVDVRGFSRLGETLPAAEIMTLLSEYQRRMVPLVRAHGGAVDKFMGDGILASFGAATPSEHYAADAMRATDAIMAEAEAWAAERKAAGRESLRIGAAVSTGRVVFGAVGDESQLEYTVIGAAVNLAAKLEKHTKTERVRALTTARCYALALAQGYAPSAFEREDRPARRIMGLDEPADLVVLAK